jgi:hypothetical protein
VHDSLSEVFLDLFKVCISHLDTNIRREDSRAMSPTAEEISFDNVDGDHTTLAVFSTMNVQRPK